jgi:enamidase
LHEHFFYTLKSGSYGALFRSFPALYLAGGVTTLRTGGSMSPYADLNVRRDIEAGKTLGPDVDVTAPFIGGSFPLSFGMQMQRLNTPADVEHMVSYWADEGVNSFKGYINLTRDQLAAMVRTGHARNKKVTAHLCSVTYREAADRGIDNLEHGFLTASDFVVNKTPDECPAGKAVELSLDQLALNDPRMKDLQQYLIQRKVAITSTLTIFETFTAGRPMTPQAALDLLIPELREAYVNRYTIIARDAAPLWTSLLRKDMAWEKQFHDAGGLLVAGTDPTGYGGVIAGFSATRQVELLIEAGFSLPDAVRVASLNGAKYLGRESSVGSLVVGKRADLIAFTAGVKIDSTQLPSIAWSMKGGTAYDRRRILEMWKGQVGLQ